MTATPDKAADAPDVATSKRRGPPRRRGGPFLVGDAALRGQTAILPPPCLVITTTAGRTGMSSLKSGQRVERSS